ncbi:uncharacterized protein LOC132056303 isoform X2 [Lycium ferocissimum]|uniref:uncharacterized protein LOC132056303 isoform X2 n=1 Tax=Lycium ferocissimum TaxID=112874 RepID=UPI002814D838|nr:uncharacterized protein LOC132056303 isoform X2 [Lycium ferocissimum]
MEKQVLDYVLVPVGLVFMVVYHVWLLHRILKHPSRTVIGINSINRHFWVRAMMEDPSKNGVLAVQTLRNNIMASTLLASTAIMLSSLIAVLMTGGSKGRSIGFHVYGDKSELCLSIKFFSILLGKDAQCTTQGVRFDGQKFLVVCISNKFSSHTQYTITTYLL